MMTLQEFFFRYTRRVQRKTMPDYYKSVRPASHGITPIGACKHKHESRADALLCFLDNNRNYFGSLHDSIVEMVKNK